MSVAESIIVFDEKPFRPVQPTSGPLRVRWLWASIPCQSNVREEFGEPIPVTAQDQTLDQFKNRQHVATISAPERTADAAGGPTRVCPTDGFVSAHVIPH